VPKILIGVGALRRRFLQNYTAWKLDKRARPDGSGVLVETRFSYSSTSLFLARGGSWLHRAPRHACSSRTARHLKTTEGHHHGQGHQESITPTRSPPSTSPPVGEPGRSYDTIVVTAPRRVAHVLPDPGPGVADGHRPKNSNEAIAIRIWRAHHFYRRPTCSDGPSAPAACSLPVVFGCFRVPARVFVG